MKRRYVYDPSMVILMVCVNVRVAVAKSKLKYLKETIELMEWKAKISSDARPNLMWYQRGLNKVREKLRKTMSKINQSINNQSFSTIIQSMNTNNLCGLWSTQTKEISRI